MMKDFYENYWKIRKNTKYCQRYGIFADWIGDNVSVLDIGCGDAYFGEYLIKDKKNIKYLGCDVSEEAIKMVKQRGLDAVLLDATKGGLSVFGDDQFDFVVMSEFIEHIIHAEDILKEAARIAKKGVLVSTPNVAYIRSRAALLFGRFPKQWAVAPWEHLRYWSAIDFAEIIKSIGLNLKELKAANGKKILRDLWPNLFALQICYFITK